MAIVAAIIGGVVAIGTAVTSAVITSNDAEDAKNEAKKLANIRRQDELKYADESDRVAKIRLGLDRQKTAFEMSEAKKDRAERREATEYAKQQNAFNQTIGILNNNDAMRANYLSLMKR